MVALLDSQVEQVVNISSGEGVKLKKIAGIIANKIGGTGNVALGIIKPNPFEPAELIGNAEKLKRELKWRPKWDLEKGLEQTIEWWKERFLSPENVLR